MTELREQIKDVLVERFGPQNFEHTLKDIMGIIDSQGEIVRRGQVPSWFQLDCEVKRLMPDGKFGFESLYRLTTTEGAEK